MNLDQFHFWAFPVLARTAERLLEGIDSTHLQLLNSATLGSGIIVHACAPISFPALGGP